MSPIRQQNPHSRNHTLYGDLWVSPYRFEYSSAPGSTIVTTPVGPNSGSPESLRRRPARVPDAAPQRGWIRELRRISLPLYGSCFEGESLPAISTLEFTIGLKLGGRPCWNQHISLPIGEFSKTSKYGMTMFTTDFVNPIQIHPSQELMIFAEMPIIKGNVSGTLGWAIAAEKSGEFLIQYPANGTINYIDREQE